LSRGYQLDNSNKLTGYVSWEIMREGIFNFFADPTIEPTDTLLFYYSGHGVPDKDGDMYLATSEIDVDSPYKRGFSFTELAKMAERTISSRVIIILDCCYSGLATLTKGHAEYAARLGRTAIDYGSGILEGEGRCILSSCQGLQEAYVFEEKNHSFYTYYLLQGLQGLDNEVFDQHRNITADSLSSYVYSRIVSLPPGNRPKQTPVRKIVSSGDIIVIDKTYFPQFDGLSTFEKKGRRGDESRNQSTQIRVSEQIRTEANVNKHSVKGRVTENTLYSILIQIIKEHGGSGIAQVLYNSEPDIVFNLFGQEWLLSVKIGETIRILKDAFIQYHRHKVESQIKNGIILFLPEKIRQLKPNESDILSAMNQLKCTCLIDAQVQEEFRNLTFSQVLLRIGQEIIPAISRNETKAFPLETVISLLQEHVTEMMQNIKLTDKEMLKVITDKKLLSEIGNLEKNESKDIARFLASYIVLSQILFLRLFTRSRPNILPSITGEINIHWLRTAFKRILDINYRPVFEIDVLDSISEIYVQNAFQLIEGLQIEKLRYELPGRLFHELMPQGIRKMLAAFYTRPQAADLLARLTISSSTETVYDPACGSGTILVSAYRRKLELHQQEGLAGNPHKRFCENEIFGSDIMPFAVHLSTANLAAMDPSTAIDATQIIRGDSLKLSKGYKYKSGIQLTLFPTSRRGIAMNGRDQEIDLSKVGVILMNPPFTKVERGISKYVDMNRFGSICGKEIGLWGHFISLADEFLEENGIFGGVIPISILRGRESGKIREFVLSNWTLLYVIKSTFNYGFSEWAEYRDILVVAKKAKPPKGHKVKFALVKKNLQSLQPDDIAHIATLIEINGDYSSEDLDIDSFYTEELFEKFDNLMWFCGVSDMKSRKLLVSFIDRLPNSLLYPSNEIFREGYRPVPKGVSSFVFLTRNSDPCRKEEAFLFFDSINNDSDEITVKTELGTNYQIEKSAIFPTLRTQVGVKSMDITNQLDFLVTTPYKMLDKVIRASGFCKPDSFNWKIFWSKLSREINEIRTNVVISRRINPTSPNLHHIAFYSQTEISPNNQLSVIRENDSNNAKAFCVVINSIIFLSQFFLLKEETTGRRIDIRFYDLKAMMILPDKNNVLKLVAVYNEYANRIFPPLREQLDVEFEGRYKSFWLRKIEMQKVLLEFDEIVTPSRERLSFDKAVCKALGLKLSENDLCVLYTAIINEIIMTLHLKKD
jgi:type I restriction-modification system DNA methylase subunit